MKKIKYYIPSIILMLIIYMFSCQNGEESSGLSSSIMITIQNIFPFIHNVDLLHLIIRKCAHMSEYALLTLSFIYGFSHSTSSMNKISIFSIISTFLYACSDEIHQLFIIGRSGQFTDVLIDTCGGLIMLLLYRLYKKKHNN